MKHRTSKASRNLSRDWQSMLIVFCLVFILAAFLCWELNRTIATGSSPLQNTKPIPVTINRDLMDKVVNFYKSQEDSFNQVKNAPVDQADPSK